MGLIVEVYKFPLGDATNNGVSGRVGALTLTNVDGPFEPTERAPAAKLVKRSTGNLTIVPDGLEGKWTMFGGNFGYTSDSRFNEAVRELSGYAHGFPVAIHDRVEF